MDTPGWFDGFAQALVDKINESRDHASFLRTAAEVPAGGIAFFPSCLRIVPKDVLDRSLLNVVVHASALSRAAASRP